MTGSQLTEDQKNQVRYWIRLGCDLVASDTRIKQPIEKWSENTIGEPDYESRLENGFLNQWDKMVNYDDGVAVICGQLRHGLYKDKWLSCFDFDNKDSFAKFCDLFGTSLEELSKKTLVEWHGSEVKIHVFLMTDSPLKDLTIDGFEIKGTNKKLAFVSPSPYKDGIEQYRAYNKFNTSIAIIDNVEKKRFESIIELLVKALTNDNQSYFEGQNETGEYIDYLEKEGTILRAGERHDGTVRMGTSIFFRFTGEYGCLCDSERYNKLVGWHKIHCYPSLFDERGREKEVEKIWNDIVRKFTGKRQEERDKRKHELGKTTESQPKIEENKSLIEDATEAVLKGHRFVTLEESDTIYYYDNNGLYLKGGEVVIKKTLEDLYGYNLNISKRTEIREHIKNKTYRKWYEFDSDIKIINLENGLYDFQTNKLREHTPDYLSMNQKPVVFNASAPIPINFIKFVKQIVYPSDVWTLIELMAYTFYRDNPFEIITTLNGGGSNGKGVLFGILAALHGFENVSNVSLKTMIDRPFGLYDLVGKDVNLDAELSSDIIKDTAILKKITGRQPTRVEQKGERAFDVLLHAKIWNSTNKIPSTEDETNAYYRRNVIISCPHTFEELDYSKISCPRCAFDRRQEDIAQGVFEVQPDIIRRLTTPEELSGIFNLLMFALRRILQENRIYMTEKTIKERREKYEMAVNPVKAFLEAAISEESLEQSHCITKPALHEAFKHFCAKKKLAVMSIIQFGKILKREGVQEFRETSGKKWRTLWMGLQLTEEYQKVIKEYHGTQQSLENDLVL